MSAETERSGWPDDESAVGPVIPQEGSAAERLRLARQPQPRLSTRGRQMDRREAGRRELRQPRLDLSPGEGIDSLLRRVKETIERSRASLAEDPPAPGRQPRSVPPPQQRQPWTGRVTGQPVTARAPLPDLHEPVGRARVLRRQAIDVIAGFAATEDKVAEVHERLASRWPTRANEYRHVAQVAREAAQRAREIVRTFERNGG